MSLQLHAPEPGMGHFWQASETLLACFPLPQQSVWILCSGVRLFNNDFFLPVFFNKLIFYGQKDMKNMPLVFWVSIRSIMYSFRVPLASTFKLFQIPTVKPIIEPHDEHV